MNPTHSRENVGNQTLFLHGFSISLGEGIWGRLFGDVSVAEITESYLDKPRSGFVPFSSGGPSVAGLFGFRGGKTSGGGNDAEQNDEEQVTISEFDAIPDLFHPAQIINTYLMEKALCSYSSLFTMLTHQVYRFHPQQSS
jgi:hypothetical protein